MASKATGFKIERMELRYIVLAGLFALLWFFLIFPWLQGLLINTPPPLQWFIIEGGVFITLGIFFNGLLKNPIPVAIASFCLLVMIDLLSPPYFIDMQGHLLAGPIGSMATPDYAFGWIYTQLGLTGIIVPILVYPVSAIILSSVGAFLLAPKKFKESLSAVV